MDDTYSIIIIIAANLVAGFIGAQVGGGGMISLPVLLLLGIKAPNAVAISKFADIFLNSAGAIQYLKNKKIPFRPAILFGAVCTIGGIIGAFITLNFDDLLLKKIISIILIFIFFLIIFKNQIGLIDQKYSLKKKHLFFLLPILLMAGIYGGAVGIATTTFLLLFFVFQGQSFSQSMGFSLFISFLVALSSSIIFIANGAVIFKYAIPQAIASGIGAYLGAKFAIKKGNVWVKGLFIVIVSIFIIKLIIESYIA